MDKLLIDFADEATDFDKFKAAVVQFVEQSDPDTQHEWQCARDDVRAGTIQVPDDLPRETDEASFVVDVALKHLDTATPQDNLSWRGGNGDSAYGAAA